MDHRRIQKEGRIARDGPLKFLYATTNTYFKETKMYKESQQQKLLSSSLTIAIDFLNHLKPKHAEFLRYIFKKDFEDIAFLNSEK